MSVWKLLEGFLCEEKMYRGETMVRMKDLRALFTKLSEPDKKSGRASSSDPQVSKEPNPEGGSVVCMYPVDARVWGRWSPNLDFAKILAGTDKQDTQNQGRNYGGMMTKGNWGGKVAYTPGPQNATRSPQAGSSMDRYDVLMVADIQGNMPGQPINWAPDQKEHMPKILVQKIVWSPAIGTAEERQARLQALLSGQSPQALSRRPQPEQPGHTPTKGQEPPAPQPVPRQGQVSRRPKAKVDGED